MITMPVVYEAAVENRKRLLLRFARVSLISLMLGTVLHMGTRNIISHATHSPVKIHFSINHITAPLNVPVSLTIPAIRIDTALESVGVSNNGQIESPHDVWNAGWFNQSSRPGESGRIIIDGHYDSETGKAIFYSLNQLKPGNAIYLSSRVGTTYSYRVKSVQRYDEGSFPASLLDPRAVSNDLILITCGGTFDELEKAYSHRDVVIATPLDS